MPDTSNFACAQFVVIHVQLPQQTATTSGEVIVTDTEFDPDLRVDALAAIAALKVLLTRAHQQGGQAGDEERDQEGDQ